MMRMLGVVMLMLIGISGCGESGQVTFASPGVYKGAPDPLIGNVDTAALKARFAGQTDR